MNSSIDGICKLCSKEEMASSKLRDSRRFKAPSLNAEKWEMEQEQEQEQEQEEGSREGEGMRGQGSEDNVEGCHSRRSLWVFCVKAS